MLQFQKYIQEEFKINYVEFDNILLSNSQDYLIAGSIALYYYYIQEGIVPGFVPNDLDIFISTDHISYKNNKIIKLIIESGYIIKKDESTEPYFNYFIKSGHIKSGHIYWRYFFSFINVVTYYNEKTTKKIQIINIRLKEKYYLLDFIKCSFDLSVCITWLDMKQKKFRTLQENLTRQKIMFVANRHTNKFQERIKKYIDRGFKRIDYIIFDSDKRLYRDIIFIIKKYIS